MRKQHNELAMGITVVVIAAAVIIGILYLQRPGILASGLRVQMMIDHVQSLARGDEVRYRGVRIGTVQSISFEKEGLDVILQIDPGVAIPADSKFVVESGGILSDASVVIEPGSSNRNLPPNAVVQASQESGLLTALTTGTAIQDRIQNILDEIQKFPEAEIGTRLKNALDTLNTTTSNLNSVIADNRATVNDILTNLDSAVKTSQGDVNDVVTRLNTDIVAFRDSLGGFDQTLNDTRAAVGQLNSVVSSLNSGRGSAGKLLTDDTLYRKMNDTLDAIQALAKDIKENPKKYVTVRVF